TVRSLLRQGADPNAPVLPVEGRPFWKWLWDLLHRQPTSPALPCTSVLLKAVGWLPENPNSDKWDNVDTVQALVDAGANINFHGDDNSLRTIPIIGGGLSQKPNIYNDNTHWQTTPLITAAALGKWKILKMLLAHKVEIDAIDSVGN